MSVSVSVTFGARREQYKIEKFTGDNSTTNFSTANVFRTGSLFVMVNGVPQEKDVDYTEDNDKLGFTFSTAPATGDKIEARYVKN